jgi:thiol-disulfide isomerase/thioredoxin
MSQKEVEQNGIGAFLSAGRSFEEFVGSQAAGLREVKLSPDFLKAVRDVSQAGKIKLVVFADMGCPDCRAVLPFLGKIAEANPDISLVFGEWNAEAEKFLEGRLGTGRVPTVLAMSAEGELMDGAFIERPLAVHRAVAEAASRKEGMIAIGRFRNGGDDALIEEDLLKVLRGEKTDVLKYLK